MTDLRRKRIVYMSDQEWATIREQGKLSDRSASAFIRDAVIAYGEPRVSVVEATHFAGMAAPVLEWRPVPKPSKAKK